MKNFKFRMIREGKTKCHFNKKQNQHISTSLHPHPPIYTPPPTPIIYDIAWKPNSLIVFLYIFLNNLQMKTLFFEFAKFCGHHTDEGLGNWADFNLFMITTLPTEGIELSCPLHTVLYIDYMLLTNYSFHSNSYQK